MRYVGDCPKGAGERMVLNGILLYLKLTKMFSNSHDVIYMHAADSVEVHNEVSINKNYMGVPND